MKFYTIEKETNNIAVHASAKQAQAVTDAERFASEATLTKVAAAWPTSRLVSIWNTLPGVVPVTKFASRKLALSRIWKSVQVLGEETTAAAAGSGPKEQDGGRKMSAGTTHPSRPAIRGKSRKADRTVSRTDTILNLLRPPEGAGLNEIMRETGWQSHSVRGFISGTVRKKMKLSVISASDENGVRNYRIEG